MFVKFCPASGRAEFFGHALVMCQASCWRLGRSRAGPQGGCYPGAHDVRTLVGVMPIRANNADPRLPGRAIKCLGTVGPYALGCSLEHQRWVNPRWQRGVSMQRSCTETRASTEGVLMAPALGQRLPPAPLRLPQFPRSLHSPALSLERQRGGGTRNLE